jgi:hypothetical protein
MVLFPGWWVDGVDAETKVKAWVLNPKGLHAFLKQETESLSAADVALVAHRIAVHVRGNRVQMPK